jgi:type VI secretion system secreted protein VgrG
MCVHAAPVPLPPPHGAGVVIDGSPTVLINNLPACRMGDTILEAFGPPDKILRGEVTVIIGDAGGGSGGDGGGGGAGAAAAAAGAGAAGSATEAAAEAEKKRQEMLDRIRDGKSNIKIDGDDAYKKKTMEALDRLSQTPTGRGLLEDLEKSGKPVTIKPTEPGKGNTENADNWNDGLYDQANNKPGKGSGSTVNWNPDRDKLNGEDWMERDPAIGLGHELIHSHHDANGTTDGRKSVDYTDANGTAQKAPGYELQTVGLGPHKDAPYTENKLREDFDKLGVSNKGKEAQRPRY